MKKKLVAGLVTGAIVFGLSANVYAINIWQIGVKDGAGTAHGYDGTSEFVKTDSVNGSYSNVFNYYVDLDANSSSNPSMPGYLGRENLVTTLATWGVSDGRPIDDVAKKINIYFDLANDFKNLLLTYGRSGSETDTLTVFPGPSFSASFVGSTENSYAEKAFSLGGATSGSYGLSLEYAGGGVDNGHYIDFLSLSGTPGTPSPVPEPATLLLFGTGIAALAGNRVRRKKRT